MENKSKMANYKNKEQRILMEFDRNRYLYDDFITLDRVIEQFCLEHKISIKKLKNYFNFFCSGNKIYMINKKAGLDVELLESKEHEEIIKILSKLENKTTHHYCCNFRFADFNYDIYFFHFVECKDRDISRYDRPINVKEDFENMWGNVVRIVEDLR